MVDNKTDINKSLIVFQGNKIRRTWHNYQWYFVVLDIVQVLTDSVNPSDYLKKLRKRDETLNEGWGQIVTPLRIDTNGL
jgi:prophage antirepressor-like protein